MCQRKLNCLYFCPTHTVIMSMIDQLCVLLLIMSVIDIIINLINAGKPKSFLGSAFQYSSSDYNNKLPIVWDLTITQPMNTAHSSMH